jgi:hypothetical protein
VCTCPALPDNMPEVGNIVYYQLAHDDDGPDPHQYQGSVVAAGPSTVVARHVIE